VKAVSAALLGGLVAAVLVAAPTASAATTFGSNCAGESGGVKTFVQLARANPSIPVRTTSPGVVTSWSVTAGAVPTLTEKLKIFAGTGSELETVAESEPQTVVGNRTNVFPARIPVPAGAVFGGYSGSGMLFCTGVSGDTIGYLDQETFVGSKEAFSTDFTHIVPLSVTVEPDVDGDGFGDETQDKCPQSAATQGACPVAPTTPPPGAGSLSLKLKAKLEGNVVAVQLTGNEKATVKVSDVLRGRAVAGPSSVTVEPGQTGRAYLPLNQAVKGQLAKLPRKRHLTLVIEAKGQTAGGATGSASLELAMPGRKKAAKHRRHRHS
jgi:hypothetical protein